LRVRAAPGAPKSKMDIKTNSLIEKLLSLDLPSDDYAVFGSGCMLARGLIDSCHDVDVIARGRAWEKACTLGTPENTKLGSGRAVTLFNGDIEIFNGWAPGEWDINELIGTSDVISGIRFVTLDNLLKWMKMMSREKDFARIKLIENYLSNHP
jgi:hypothetical protein